MTSPLSEQRQAAVDGLISKTRSLLDHDVLERSTLASIKAELDVLAQEESFWSNDDYPAPEAEEQQNRFLIGGEDNDGITLYLNVMRPGKVIPPHNHTVWACVAAISGIEHNTLYDRLDDESVPGKAEIKAREVVALAPGNSLAMMADDIHSVEIRGEDIIRHLHFYGRPLETLNGRKMYDMSAGTYRVMDIGVKTKS